MLKALNSVIPPRTGSYWLAAGIKLAIIAQRLEKI